MKKERVSFWYRMLICAVVGIACGIWEWEVPRAYIFLGCFLGQFLLVVLSHRADREEAEHLEKIATAKRINDVGRSLLLFKSEVSYEEGQYFITYKPLDICVWGDEKSEANEAFLFTIQSLYDTYYNSPDSELTEGAQKIKSELHCLLLKN